MLGRSQFVCQQCSYESSKWFGKCPECGTWNSAVESVQEYRSRRSGERERKQVSKPISLASVPSKSTARLLTKISELDRVLGGGLVSGQVVLVAGEPGIGKSTLLLQVAGRLAGSSQQVVLYVSGEESASQIKLRAERLGVKNKSIKLLEETDIDSVINTILTILTFKDRVLHGVIVDSIQTMYTSDLSGMSGSVGQVRECTYRLVRIAKSNNIPIFIVGHVTKEGTMAGPAVLAHIVDTILWFEGDKTLQIRLLRAIKNRFGPTDEVGIFEMEDKGLISASDPEKLFLTSSKKADSGSVVTSILEGTRPILVEIQSLVVVNKFAYPKRVSQGMDIRKLELLIAVLQKRCGLPLYEQDVFVNVTGGISIKNDPSADLAVCLSIASAYFDKPLPAKSLAIGEVGLLGDVRAVTWQEKRIKEAKRLGYTVPITDNEIRYLQEGIKKYLK
ncbi:DNA repair protein RadA [Candidatus Woesebacteria bacterium RIFCSPLOWO2_01_FULL_39_61]|uniref:DNA repair protein RadA n=1 Tax=Candidatus Woesebacteria bacterium RIFCSPHIGHO2_02_FULL_39_13 TaxID=1802505 RepID=A0A1F7YZP3_9BACT|nr:MAG: DNA repair protein RadA [Candidatus Woesebacteria bacterium RIFCSPHIGHO2_01_FULL_39_95]OGM31945.1 MAG: DNA repair protein RadA [Candidatus Woesebacteria bacterium RIFCSPHIGHO2_02_FULL_39_13]OGM36509.1 MAG: DNA repair protein RadA [Candidatus Woesebacteria bacterium RIFCSPHIGHO2_12_FULL_40_20]OGM65530.1 MAG: DNA repair protein RadA [Candidatus Woesebacteria bacterium RIFCSPLOWO2_01_FULL_39_61]OGM73195.1 MAG: DNA repair protein RadA [Candidatus Woesebacteria bacterium RIFCSPLOWO2_12_FULL_